MYPPAATSWRADGATPDDRDRIWRRGDQEFFADDACHILAFAAASVHPQLSVVALRRSGDPHASHAIASDGHWAFDHTGWVPETELLERLDRDEPGSWETLRVDGDLGTYCFQHRAWDRHEFAHDPWWRAIAYLAKFPPPPAVSAAWRDAVPVEIPEQPSGPTLVR